jgi:hypothetical protein
VLLVLLYFGCGVIFEMVEIIAATAAYNPDKKRRCAG